MEISFIQTVEANAHPLSKNSAPGDSLRSSTPNRPEYPVEHQPYRHAQYHAFEHGTFHSARRNHRSKLHKKISC